MSKPSIYTPIATGSTMPRDIRDRLSDIPNVKDFGAIGDGITDDSLAFSAAATAADGKPVFIPQGSYIINNNISGKFFSYGRINTTGTGHIVIYDLLSYNSDMITVTNGVIDTALYFNVTCILDSNLTLSFINTPIQDVKTICLMFKGPYNVTWPDNIIANGYDSSILSPGGKIVKITTYDKGGSWVVEDVITIPPDSISFEITLNTSGANTMMVYPAGGGSARYYLYKVPFTLYNTDVSVTVDWGDGSPTETLTSNDFSKSFDDVPYHVYPEGQTATITFTTERGNFSKLYYITAFTYYTAHNIEIDGSVIANVSYSLSDGIIDIPEFLPFKGTCMFGTTNNVPNISYSTNDYSRIFSGYRGSTISDTVFKKCRNITTFSRSFTNSKLTAVPTNLFKDCVNATDFNHCFSESTLLTSIPENLFVNCTNILNVSSCFSGCSSLTSFTLRFTSPSINNVSDFVSVAGNYTIYVPANSTSYTTFSSNTTLAERGVTVIGY